MTRFFKGLFIFLHVAMAAVHTSAYYQKTEVCIVRSGLLLVLATEGSRVTEKKVNVTQVSRTVFSLLKLT